MKRVLVRGLNADLSIAAARAFRDSAQTAATQALGAAASAAANVTSTLAGYVADAQAARTDVQGLFELVRDISQVDVSDDAVDVALRLPGGKAAATLNTTIAAAVGMRRDADRATLRLSRRAPVINYTAFGDNFTAPDGTSLNGRTSNLGTPATWTANTYTITGGQASAPADGLLATLATGVLAGGSYIATARMTPKFSGGDKGMPALVLFYVDPANFWYLTLNNVNSATLYKVSSGGHAIVASVPVTLDDGNEHVVSATVDGNKVTTRVDDLVLWTGTDPTIAASSVVGLRSGNLGSGQTGLFNTLTVTGNLTANVARYSGDDFTTGTTITGRTAAAGRLLAWQGTVGWAIAAGVVSATAAGVATLSDPTLADVDYTLTARLSADTATSRAGLVFRYANAQNYWYYELQPDQGDGGFAVFRVIDAEPTKVMVWTSPYAAGSLHDLRVDIFECDITLWADGVEIGTISDTTTGYGATGYGLRAGSAQPCTFDSIGAAPFAGTRINWPRVELGRPATLDVPLGAEGSWEDTDINDPNVVWDHDTMRWANAYTGYRDDPNDTAIHQQLGIAYADTLNGPWTKAPGNPVFGVADDSQNAENGGLVYVPVFRKWLHNYNVAGSGEIRFATAEHLTGPWTRIAPVLLGSDPFLRVQEDGVTVECWWGAGYPNAKLYRALSTDLGQSWSAPEVTIATNPKFGAFGGNAEPTVYVPPGKEGKEMLVFCDIVENVHGSPFRRSIVCAATLDGGTTWHWRLVGGGSNQEDAFDRNQWFDSSPVYAEGAFHLFIGAAKYDGLILNIGIQLGHVAVDWSPYRTLSAGNA